MPKSSLRADTMPPSPIRKLMPYADAAKARGTKIFHLNIGQPDVMAPTEFWDGVKAVHGRIVDYTHSQGTPGLRAAMREFYASIGIELSDSELLVTTAGSEAVLFAMMCTCNPGDEVIVPEPFYANYLGFSVPAGVKIVPITTRLEDNYALPSAEEFERRITPNTKAILICNPSNPTGTVYSDDQLMALRDLVLKHDLFLIADEVYREFNYTGAPIRSVLQLEGLENHAVMVDSVSKRYSLCGARVGFLASRHAEVMSGAARFAQARLSPPLLEQIGVEAATKTPQAHFDAMREEYTRRRDVLVRELASVPGVVVPKIDGAFYAMVRLPIDDCDKFCQWLLESFELDGQTLMLAPASGFYATPGLGKDEVRIAYVLECDKIVEAVRCLRVALERYPGRVPTPAGAAN
ncbi:MAG: pyridoxal phosphate-dependent aminotransferase [Chthonomonas sp.]|nr:pyridoxal phosphate-dependent aminotransferase [Chthonomonas sp.]